MSQVIRTVEEALVRLFIIRHLLSTIFKGHLEVLINLLKKHRSSIVSPPHVPEGAVESSVLKKHYIAPVTFRDRSKYTTSDIAFFVALCNQIKSSERLEDKKHQDSNGDSPLVLAFVAPELSVAASPSTMTASSKRRKVTSPSNNGNVYVGAMELFSDSEDDANHEEQDV